MAKKSPVFPGTCHLPRTLPCLLCWLAIVLACTADFAVAAGADDLLKTVAERTRDTRTLHAAFRQERNLSILDRPLVSSGHLCVRRNPDDPAASSVLWAYTAPLASGFVWESGKARRWGNEGQPVQARDAEAALMDVIARQVLDWIAIDPAATAKRYQTETVDTPQGPGVRLRPREPGQSPFIAMTAIFAPTLDRLAGLVFVDTNGDATTLRFENVQVNRPLPEECRR
ncbi:MAG: outer membrane lipoprotein carrier protein LolA [Desulfovibrio sp.]|jgi:hypothetical protein|nr:outer membrane lipoprotein carrier protein LolA [Desulfovibrio sp.]